MQDKNSVENSIENEAELPKERAVEDVEEPSADSPQEQTKVVKSKFELAKEKIENAKVRSAQAKVQIEECLENIESDTKELEELKKSLQKEAIDNTNKLFDELGVEIENVDANKESQIGLVSAEDGEVEIKDLKSGKVGAFLWALLSMIAVFAAWCYIATSSLGLPIIPDKFPDIYRLTKALEWTSKQLGQGESASVGAAVVVGVLLVLGWLIYMILVSIRHSKNLRLAEQTDEAVSLYCTNKEDCKAKMKIVREHIQNSTKTLTKYKVLLEEQNAKLKRALVVEEANGYDSLHNKTKEEIEATQKLIGQLKKLLDTPISESGVLSKEAIETLKHATKEVNEHIMKIYK